MRGPFPQILLSFLALQTAMALGALVCLLLGGAIRAMFAATYHPGTIAYFVGDLFFLIGPVVAWLITRGASRRDVVALAGAMLAPVAVILTAGALIRYDYLLWLVTAMYPAMSLGMVVYLLFGGSVARPATA